jgi:hypothetical protein
MKNTFLPFLKCNVPALSLFGLVSLLAISPVNKVLAAGLKELPLDECSSLAQSSFKPSLSAEWENYLAYTKVCPLRKNRSTQAAVMLVSVFIEDYYKANPTQKDLKKFPLPILFSNDDKCLAKLPEHFPFDQPVDLTLSFGQWQKNIPTRIEVHVSNPTAGGDYALPVLLWDAKKQKFIAKKDTERHKIGETECPI